MNEVLKPEGQNKSEDYLAKLVRIGAANFSSLCCKEPLPKLGRSCSQLPAECRRSIHELPADGARARTVSRRSGPVRGLWIGQSFKETSAGAFSGCQMILTALPPFSLSGHNH